MSVTSPDRTTATNLHMGKENNMILLGIVLLIIGAIAGLSIFWVLGGVIVVVGVVFAIAGHAGHQLAGRSHWY